MAVDDGLDICLNDPGIRDMRSSFGQQTIVITGSTAGVGRGLALFLAAQGARVGLIARCNESLADVARQIAELGGRAATAAVDVSDPAAVFQAAEAIERELGPIDIWINNAMVTVFSPIIDMSPAEFRRVTEVTYLGSVYGAMAALRLMRPRDVGKIVQIGSSLSYRGIPLQSAYCGAKFAIRGFLDSLRTELIHDRSRIRVIMVQLPAVNTPQFDWARTSRRHEPRPVPPIIQVETVARAIARAIQGSQREYWLHISSAKVIIGSLIVPAFLDRYLAKHAYEAQDRDTIVASDRSDNLFSPVPGLHRARGSFSAEARTSAGVLSATGARAALATLVIGTIALGALALLAI
jgi:NAD(P)-dependent dehydrogenase (short-subunit alcohol dehydrogenase family)